MSVYVCISDKYEYKKVIIQQTFKIFCMMLTIVLLTCKYYRCTNNYTYEKGFSVYSRA